MFGGGFRNPKLWYVRIGLLVIVVSAGAIFHRTGPAYTAIRLVYLVVIVGGLLYTFSRRKGIAGGQNQRYGRSPFGGPFGQRPPFGGQRSPFGGQGPQWGGGQPIDVRQSDPTPSSGAAPGWFPDPMDPRLERYWDGTNWGTSRPKADAGGTAN